MLKMLWTSEYDEDFEAKLKKVVDLKRAGFNVHGRHKEWMSEDEVDAALDGIDIFFVGYDPITERVLKNHPELKLILSVRDGPEENIDLKACEAYGVPVLNSAGRNSASVAELTFGLILNMARPMIQVASSIWRDKFNDDNFQELRNICTKGPCASTALAGKTFGIIGLGKNGKRLATIGQGFQMNVIAYDPFISAEDMKKLNVTKYELNDLMAKADYISIMARVTKDNEGLVGKEQIDLMKPTAAIVNTARAKLMDTDALVQALNENRIRMAALDVFEKRPPHDDLPDDSKYYTVKDHRLILTNHMAGFCLERTQFQNEIAYSNLEEFINGEELTNNCTKNVFDSPAFKERGGILYGSRSINF